MRLLLLLMLLSLASCQSSSSEAQKPIEMLGTVTTQAVLDGDQRFAQNYESYQPASAEIAAVQKIDGKSLIVLFGAWCHDSQREVPRLLKLLDSSGVKLKSLQLVAVNQQKQEPSGLHRTMALRFTPTIILMDGNTELGRIIERPQTSLGQDLADMLQ